MNLQTPHYNPFESDASHSVHPPVTDAMMGPWVTAVASAGGQAAARQQDERSAAGRPNRFLQRLVALNSSIAQATDVHQAELLAVNRLRALLNAGQVVLARRESAGSGFRIAAVSDVEMVDATSEPVRLMQQACVAFSDEADITTCHPDQANISVAALPLKNYASLHATAAAAVRGTSDRGRPHTLFLVAAASSTFSSDEDQRRLATTCRLVGQQLKLLRDSKRTPWQLTRSWLKNVSTRRGWQLAAAISLFSLIGLAIPSPYRIACDAELQPVVRRFVAAPFDAVLQQASVKNGDIVQAGQVLAELDGRQLRLEISGLQAEYQAQVKASNSALARGSVAESQIATKQMEQIQAKIDLLHNRLGRLHIRSPIAGVIVSGDLDDAEGAPLEMGVQLFEVAPLDRMQVAVHIPEREIQHARVGMPVTLKLDAFPFDNWTGALTRIHKRAEIVDDSNVFVGELELENAHSRLRPGMKGRVTLQGDHHPLGWNWFHHAGDRLLGWLF